MTFLSVTHIIVTVGTVTGGQYDLSLSPSYTSALFSPNLCQFIEFEKKYSIQFFSSMCAIINYGVEIFFDHLRLPVGICQATDANSFQKWVCYVMIKNVAFLHPCGKNFASAFTHQGAVSN